MEPFALFSKYLPDPWRKIITDKELSSDTDTDPLAIATFDKNNRPPQYLHGRIKRTEVSYPKPQKPEELVDLFTNRMYDIGINRSIVYPTAMLGMGEDPRLDLEVAVSNAYTDYMLDNFLGKYPEIHTMIYAPANSPDKTAELIDRVGSEKGITGVMISAVRPTPAGNESWIPIYEAATRKNLPVCFHGGLSTTEPFKSLGRFIAWHCLSFSMSVITHLTSLVTEGIPERFPKLKFVFMEGGTSWLPWIMYRLDREYISRKSEVPFLKKMPSEYIKEFYFTSQPLEYFHDRSEQESIFKMFDAENHLLYASDYPHWDFDLPNSIYDLPFLSKTAKRKILGENSAKLFNIR